MFFATYVGDLFAGGRSSREKHLEKFSRILFSKCFVAFPGDWLATWISRKNRVCCTNRSVFKRFQFSLEHSDYSLSSPFKLSLKLTVLLSKNLHFCIISSSNLQGKGMGFFSLTSYFMIMVLFSWFVSYFCDLSNVVFKHGFGLFGWVSLIECWWYWLRCFPQFFFWWCLCSMLCLMTVLLYTYHVHGRVLQWQLFVTVWCSLTTLFWVVIDQPSSLDTC